MVLVAVGTICLLQMEEMALSRTGRVSPTFVQGVGPPLLMKAEKTADQQTPRKMWRRAFRADAGRSCCLACSSQRPCFRRWPFRCSCSIAPIGPSRTSSPQLAEATAGAAIETVDRQLQGMVTTLRGSFDRPTALNQGNLPEIYYEAARTALAGTETFFVVVDKST